MVMYDGCECQEFRLVQEKMAEGTTTAGVKDVWCRYMWSTLQKCNAAPMVHSNVLMRGPMAWLC